MAKRPHYTSEDIQTVINWLKKPAKRKGSINSLKKELKRPWDISPQVRRIASKNGLKVDLNWNCDTMESNIAKILKTPASFKKPLKIAAETSPVKKQIATAKKVETPEPVYQTVIIGNVKLKFGSQDKCLLSTENGMVTFTFLK